MKFITIEVKEVKGKRKYIAGALVAQDVEDAYEQMGQRMPNEMDETLVIKHEAVPQLIVDLHKMAKKL